MKFYSVRDADNHSALFFSNVTEMREVDEIVQSTISEALRMFITDGAEAKN